MKSPVGKALEKYKKALKEEQRGNKGVVHLRPTSSTHKGVGDANVTQFSPHRGDKVVKYKSSASREYDKYNK